MFNLSIIMLYNIKIWHTDVLMCTVSMINFYLDSRISLSLCFTNPGISFDLCRPGHAKSKQIALKKGAKHMLDIYTQVPWRG